MEFDAKSGKVASRVPTVGQSTKEIEDARCIVRRTSGLPDTRKGTGSVLKLMDKDGVVRAGQKLGDDELHAGGAMKIAGSRYSP